MTRTISPPFPNFRPISNKPGVALENKARRLGERERFMPRLMAPAAILMLLFEVVPIVIGADASFRD